MTIAEEIARYAHRLNYNELSKETIHSAKARIIDTFGCGIGAFNETPCAIARKTVSNIEAKYSATVLGTYNKTTPELAAFANGTMSRYFDYNDSYEGKEFSHPSDNIFPVLAVAEAEGKDGKDALLAIVLAYEIQCRLAEAANLWKKGWDHVIYGLVSVAAAASKLMDATVEETTNAINIALDSHLTMRQVRAGELSMWKAPVFANSARNAVFSATLAKNGMTGPSPIFEGEMGFWNLVSGKFDLDTKKFGNKRNQFKINETLIKFYPAETRTQTGIWAAIDVRKSIPSVDKIAKVEIGTNEGGYRILGKDPEKWNPKTKETADHSYPFIIAAALMDGKIDQYTFLESRFRDKATLDLMKKITVKENKKYTDMFNKGGTVNASDITVKLKNGKTLYSEQIYSRGHPKNPMNDKELEEKFKHLTDRWLRFHQADYLLERLWNFEKMVSLEQLFSICTLK